MSHIDSNIAFNKKLLKSPLYDGLLERRIGNFKASRLSVLQKVKIAQSIYKMLGNGSRLINPVANANNEYSLIVNFERPELKIFVLQA